MPQANERAFRQGNTCTYIFIPKNHGSPDGRVHRIPLTGNAVRLKPANITPESWMVMQDGSRQVGRPEDVFTVANGPGSTVGSALVDSVHVLRFAGSTQVGKRLLETRGQAPPAVDTEPRAEMIR